MSKSLVTKDIVKIYGDYKAVNKANLNVKEGELFTLLGPSGCGKTTLLRMIAGFNEVDEGEIYFDNILLNDIPAHKRDIGMVFQNYAIFPHLTVRKNVEYGLKARKVAKSEMKERVDEALKMVQMEEYADRQPSQLSGGQQQRVALARSIVIHPRMLLMDEPLSNLDAKLRVQMRNIIRRLQKRLGITTVYVTHDQEEALAISDRVAIMDKGVIQQIGRPDDIYERPVNVFVANFIGTSNFIDVDLEDSNENTRDIFLSREYKINLPVKRNGNKKGIMSVRPEEFIINGEDKPGILGTISLETFLGDFINYEIELDTGEIVEVNEYTKDVDFIRNVGERVSLTVNERKINLYDEKGEFSLL